MFTGIIELETDRGIKVGSANEKLKRLVSNIALSAGLVMLINLRNDMRRMKCTC